MKKQIIIILFISAVTSNSEAEREIHAEDINLTIQHVAAKILLLLIDEWRKKKIILSYLLQWLQIQRQDEKYTLSTSI